MKSLSPLQIFNHFSFLTLALVLVLLLIPHEALAQREHTIRPIDMIQPVGTPPAQRVSPITPKADPSELKKLAEAPKDKETAIRDSVSATDLAWTYFDKQKYAKSQEWFTLALEWYPGNLHAAEGLIMAMFEGGDPQTAYYVARELNEKIPGIKDLVIESASTRARGLIAAGKPAEARTWVTGFPSDEMGFATVLAEIERTSEDSVLKLATINGIQNGKNIKSLPAVSPDELLTHAKGAMQEGRYHVSQWYLSQVEATQQLDRETSIMKAWNYYHTRRFDLGATLFEELYREEETIDAAEGLAFCLQQSRNFDKLTALSNELGGLLVGTAGPIIQIARKKQEQADAINAIAEGKIAPLTGNEPVQKAESNTPEPLTKPVVEKLQAIR